MRTVISFRAPTVFRLQAESSTCDLNNDGTQDCIALDTGNDGTIVLLVNESDNLFLFRIHWIGADGIEYQLMVGGIGSLENWCLQNADGGVFPNDSKIIFGSTPTNCTDVCPALFSLFNEQFRVLRFSRRGARGTDTIWNYEDLGTAFVVIDTMKTPP